MLHQALDLRALYSIREHEIHRNSAEPPQTLYGR
jgi:hypothetical protein